MKTKIYDKEIYKKSERMKSIFIILFIFLFSFLIGYFICRFEMQKVINEKELLIRNHAVELDSLRETIYMYNIYGK